MNTGDCFRLLELLLELLLEFLLHHNPILCLGLHLSLLLQSHILHLHLDLGDEPEALRGQIHLVHY